jgi:hypothetical protein
LLHAQRRRSLVFPPDAVQELLAVNRDLAGRRHAEAHLIPADREDDDLHGLPDQQALARFSAHHQHGEAPLPRAHEVP